jgi:hypothetical protein
MLTWLNGSSTESAIRKLENGLAASTAKRARLDSKLQEQREIEARARKEIADAHVRPLTEREDALLDNELDDLMRALDYFAVSEIWILEARYHVTSLQPNPGPTPRYVTDQAHQLLCARRGCFFFTIFLLI